MSIFKDLLEAAREDEPQPEPEISSKKKGGKRSHPNYRQTTIYIDKVLHRQLLRMLEDSGFDGDFSEWIEQKMKGEIDGLKNGLKNL